MASQFVPAWARKTKLKSKVIDAGPMAQIVRRLRDGTIKEEFVGANRAQYRALCRDSNVIFFEILDNIPYSSRPGWDFRKNSEKIVKVA